MKLWGLILLVAGDMLLVNYFTEHKKRPVQCLWEMIGFVGNITSGVTEWKRTLKKAILSEKHCGHFPKMFQAHFSIYQKELPLRDALKKALDELPLPEEAIEILAQYFQTMGKTTNKSTEESFRLSKLRLEEILNELQKELPKAKRLISSGVYSISAMVAVLLL